jgi:hypothetical protein
MILRFYRRVSLIPGLRLNASRGGLSLSIGDRGPWLTTGPRGRRATLGLPGTGLLLTQHIPPTAAAPPGGHPAMVGCADCMRGNADALKTVLTPSR